MNERNRGNATMTAAATANDQLSSESESPACDNGGADGWLGGCVPIMLRRPPVLARLMHIEDAGNTNCRFVYPSPHFHFPPRPPCMNSVTVRCPIALFAKGHGEKQNSEATIFNACSNSSWNRLWSDTVRSRARFGKQMRTFLEHIHKIPLCSPSLPLLFPRHPSLSPSSLSRAHNGPHYTARVR